MTPFQPSEKHKDIKEILWGVWIELFQRVGLSTDRKKVEAFMRQRHWQSRKTWTVANRNDFESWLVKYLVSHKEAPNDAKRIMQLYGWRVE